MAEQLTPLVNICIIQIIASEEAGIWQFSCSLDTTISTLKEPKGAICHYLVNVFHKCVVCRISLSAVKDQLILNFRSVDNFKAIIKWLETCLQWLNLDLFFFFGLNRVVKFLEYLVTGYPSQIKFVVNSASVTWLIAQVVKVETEVHLVLKLQLARK